MPSKELSGSLNTCQATGDKDRNFKGACMIGGVEFWISGWLNRNDDGSQWVNLKFNPKEQRQAQPAQGNAADDFLNNHPSEYPQDAAGAPQGEDIPF